MKNKFKIMFSLILALTLVIGGAASAAEMLFYDATDGIAYESDMSNAEIEQLVSAYKAGNKLAKVVNDKLVDYKDYRQEIVNVIIAAKAEGKTDEEAAMAAAAALADIVTDLPEVEIPTEELEVVGVSPIDPTTIKVVFSDEVPAEAAVKANFTVSKGTLESANKTGEKEVLLTVAGLDYEDVVSVTVVKPAYVKEVRVPAVDELYTLVITTDAAENFDTIKADGADMTMLTAQIIRNEDNVPVVRDAQIQFSTTLGSLSQPQVALQNGKASTQLRSISSPTSVTAIVTAVVASAPGAEQYVGLSGQKRVKFTPDGVGEGSVEMVSAVKAGADQGDRFFVTFSGDITAKAYKAGVAKMAAGDPKAGMGVVYVDSSGTEKKIDVKDVYNLRPDTLMFVLETDSDGATPSAKPTSKMIDANYTTTGEPNFLRDNVNHKIKFPGNVPGVVIGSDVITFMMSDVTKPFVYGVNSADSMTVKVRFSEAIAEDLAEGAETNVNPHFKIDGKELVLYEASAPTQATVDNAKLANQIIVTQLKVGTYTNSDSDKRNEVDIKIHKDFKLTPGTHGIQIANVGDWAGMTDKPQNIVTTQTFSFEVKADTGVPEVEVIRQSPEQFLIVFNKPIDNVTGKTVEDALKIYTKEEYAADPKVKLEQNVNSSANDYVVSVVNADGVGSNIATTTELSNVTRLLVEFNRDWSVKLKGNSNTKDNYWKSDISPLTFEIDHVESQLGLKMDKKTINVANPYDGESPTIVGAVDLFDKSPDEAFRGKTATDGGQFVFVEMSEPVQLVDETGTAITNPTTPNLEQDSSLLSTDYEEVDGLPRQTYRFIKDSNTDKVVIGKVAPGTLAQDDITFVIEPKAQLEAGVWTLYIEQISDDHGNTSATISTKVEVPESEVIVGDTRVAWAAFDNGATGGTYDYLYVKFTKVMKTYGADGVDTTMNYKFRGYDLPHGSEVFRGIDGVTDDWDGVTIRMDKTAWDGLGSADFTTNMSVASNFKSADGEKLAGPYQFELTNRNGGSSTDKDGLKNADKFEAVYFNADVALVAGKAVTMAEAKDADGDGDIDTIELTLSESGTTTDGDTIIVNGKEFVTTGTNAVTQTFVSKDGADSTKVGDHEIAGTASNNIVITLEGGAIVINKGHVEDDAKPVVTFVSSEDEDNLVVKVSEVLDFDDEDDLKAHFTLSNGTIAKAIYNKSANTITFTITGAVANDTLAAIVSLEDKVGNGAGTTDFAKVNAAGDKWEKN